MGKKKKKAQYAPERTHGPWRNGHYHCIGCGNEFFLSSSNKDTSRFCTPCLTSMTLSLDRVSS